MTVLIFPINKIEKASHRVFLLQRTPVDYFLQALYLTFETKDCSSIENATKSAQHTCAL